MPDSLTVTFGGREVVLTKVGPWVWRGEVAGHLFWLQGTMNGEAWDASFANRATSLMNDSPHAAASAVEQKLVALRDSINSVLGEA